MKNQTFFAGLLATIYATGFAASCGGGSKKPTAKANNKIVIKKPSQEKTAEELAAEREAAAKALIAEGSNCIPDQPFRYQLSMKDEQMTLCANDGDQKRALGQIACWDLAKDGTLTYKPAAPLPGRGFFAKSERGCFRGYCPPEKGRNGEAALIAWSTSGAKAAVVVGATAHLFDAETKKFESSINLADAAAGDKAMPNDPNLSPSDLVFVGDTLFVVGPDDTAETGVWMFNVDGTALGQVTSPNPKDKTPVTVHAGSVSVLDSNHVGINEAGLSSLISIEASTGKKSKLTRKLPKFSCTAQELTAYWALEDVAEKCKASIDPVAGHFIGADFIAGKKAFLVSLRGKRSSELAVLDLKTLLEKTAIPLKKCSDAAPEAAAGESK